MTDPSPSSVDPTTQAPKAQRGLNLIREIFIVIIGVLVALAADDWQESKEREERDAQVMNMVMSELQSNLAHIKASGDYHQNMYNGIQQSLDRLANEGVFQTPDDWQDVQEIPTLNAAFQLALLNGTLSRIEPNLAMKLSALYDELASFDERRNQLDLSTLQTGFRDGTRYLSLKRVALGNQLYYVEKMQPLYADAIAMIKQSQGQP